MLLCTLVGCSATQPRHSERRIEPASAAQAAQPVITPSDGFDVELDAQGWSKAGGLRYLELVSGGSERSAALPLVIVIHGLGDKPSRSWLDLIDPNTHARLIVPEAPRPYMNGFAWFDYGASHQAPEHLAAGIRGATDSLARLIEQVQRAYHRDERVVVTGFSQGGMLSYALALLRPDLVRVAIPISGMLPLPLWPTRNAGGQAPRIQALHGTADRVVPFEADRQLSERLRALQFAAELTPFARTGHTITQSMREAVRSALAEILPWQPLR